MSDIDTPKEQQFVIPFSNRRPLPILLGGVGKDRWTKKGLGCNQKQIEP